MTLEALVEASDAPSVLTGDLQTFARGVHAEMLAVNDLMARAKEQGKLPTGVLEAWRAVRDVWTKWYSAAGSGTWAKTNADTAHVLKTTGEQLIEWRKSLGRWAPSVVAADQGAGAGLGGWLVLGVLGIGLYGLRGRLFK